MKLGKKGIIFLIITIAGIIGTISFIGEILSGPVISEEITVIYGSLILSVIMVIVGAILFVKELGAQKRAFFNEQQKLAAEQAAKAEQQRIEAEKKQKLINSINERMLNTDFYSFKVAGVSFNNDEGAEIASRQSILKKIYFEDEPFDYGKDLINWTLEQYDYEGNPAIGVYADGHQVGNVPREDVPFLIENKDRIIEIDDAEIYGGGKDDFGKRLNYGCEITVALKKIKK